MALPRIAPYPLPSAADLPATRAPWTVTAGRAALLIHDMQGYFAAAFAPGPSPLPAAVANIAALRAACDARGIPVFYSVQPGKQDPRDRGLQRHLWGPGMGVEPEHQDVVTELRPGPGHLLLTKWRYSAFQRTNLEAMLRARGRDQLIVTGLYAHIGCLLSTAEAFMRDIEPFFVADAVADFSRDRHDFAVDYAAGLAAVPVTAAQILAAL